MSESGIESRKCRGVPHGEIKTVAPIVIWGAGSLAKVVTEILELAGGWEICGYLDAVNPERRKTTFEGYPILGGRETLAELRLRG